MSRSLATKLGDLKALAKDPVLQGELQACAKGQTLEGELGLSLLALHRPLTPHNQLHAWR